MKGGSAKYLIKEGFRNLWTNRLMTFASVGVLTACLLLVGFAVLFSENVSSIVGYVEEQNELVAFLKKDNTEEENLALQKQIAAMEDVDEVVYVTKEEAWDIQKEKLGDAAALLEENGDNPYYAYFTIREKDLEKIDITTAAIEKLDGIEKVNSSNGFAKSIVQIRKMVNIFGGAVIAALVLVSLVIIANTIRSAVFSRRKEINIMKYVGATNGFIRVPFLVEGVILGVIAAAVSFLLIWGGYSLLYDALTGDMMASFVANALKSMLPFREVALQVGLLFLGAGVLTGTLGSLISVRNHMKV